MSIKKRVFFIFFVFTLFVMDIFGISNMFKIREIIWDKPVIQNEKKIVVGRVNEDFGSFEFRWIINKDDSIRLVYLEAFGAGELPPVEKELLIMNMEDGVTFIFQEWSAILNKNQPESIKFITAVKTADFFSVLPFKVKIQKNKYIDTVTTVKWEKRLVEIKGKKYMKGSISFNKSKMNIAVLSENRDTSLVYLFKDSSNLVPLFLWFYNDFVFLCESKNLNKSIKSLSLLAKVSSNDLLMDINYSVKNIKEITNSKIEVYKNNVYCVLNWTSRSRVTLKVIGKYREELKKLNGKIISAIGNVSYEGHWSGTIEVLEYKIIK